jgi:hypothetical protein
MPNLRDLSILFVVLVNKQCVILSIFSTKTTNKELFYSFGEYAGSARVVALTIFFYSDRDSLCSDQNVKAFSFPVDRGPCYSYPSPTLDLSLGPDVLSSGQWLKKKNNSRV